jgi:hypothetical protein
MIATMTSRLYLFDTARTQNSKQVFKIEFATDAAKAFTDHIPLYTSKLRLIAISVFSLQTLPTTHSHVMDSVQQYRIQGERYQLLALSPIEQDAVVSLVASVGAPMSKDEINALAAPVQPLQPSQHRSRRTTTHKKTETRTKWCHIC